MPGEVFNVNKNILFALKLNHCQGKVSCLGFVEVLKLFMQCINGGCQPEAAPLRTDGPEMQRWPVAFAPGGEERYPLAT